MINAQDKRVVYVQNKDLVRPQQYLFVPRQTVSLAENDRKKFYWVGQDSLGLYFVC